MSLLLELPLWDLIKCQSSRGRPRLHRSISADLVAEKPGVGATAGPFFRPSCRARSRPCSERRPLTVCSMAPPAQILDPADRYDIHFGVLPLQVPGMRDAGTRFVRRA